MLHLLGSDRALRLNRYWRAFGYGLCALALGGALALALAPQLVGLFLLTLYCIPSNSVLPIPHEPGVLYFAQLYAPLWIALAATTASVIVSFADYALVAAAMKKPSLAGAQRSRLFLWAVATMRRWPFVIVALFSLVPLLPIAIIRVLAPASGYPVGRYVLAQIVGRLPRFYVLAWLGQTIAFPTWALALLFVVMLGLFWLTGRGRRRAPRAEGGERGERGEGGERGEAAPRAVGAPVPAGAVEL